MKARLETLFLERVRDIVQERAEVYGSSRVSCETIAKLWTIWLAGRDFGGTGEHLSGHDVAAMMTLTKFSRLMFSPDHEDSHMDIAGWAAIMNTVRPKPRETEEEDDEDKGTVSGLS